MASPSGNNKDADAESDYGSELDYNDTDLETQLTQLEEPRPPPAPVLPTPIPPLVVQQEASTVDQLRHVEIAVASTSEEPAVDEASGDSYAEVLEKALEELEVQLPPKKSLWCVSRFVAPEPPPSQFTTHSLTGFAGNATAREKAGEVYQSLT